MPPQAYLRVRELEREVEQAAKGTAVVVGISGTCPYEIGACWGGAYDALRRLEAVAFVGPIPNAAEGTVSVYLVDDRLPPLETWREQFRRIVNGTYDLRGIEVTLRGSLVLRTGQPFLIAEHDATELLLTELEQQQVVQWDQTNRTRKSLHQQEASAQAALLAELQQGKLAGAASVTGPLELTSRGPVLRVRQFALSSPRPSSR